MRCTTRRCSRRSREGLGRLRVQRHSARCISRPWALRCLLRLDAGRERSPALSGRCARTDQKLGGWDLLIAHPPCTHLAVSGARWFKDKEQEQMEALDFVRYLMSAPIPRICRRGRIAGASGRGHSAELRKRWPISGAGCRVQRGQPREPQVHRRAGFQGPRAGRLRERDGELWD